MAHGRVAVQSDSLSGVLLPAVPHELPVTCNKDWLRPGGYQRDTGNSRGKARHVHRWPRGIHKGAGQTAGFLEPGGAR